MESWQVQRDVAGAIDALRDRDYRRVFFAVRTLRTDTAANPDGMSWGQATESILRAACPTLAALAEALNGLEAVLTTDEELSSWGGRRSPLDTTSLPVFGGPEPDSTDGIYSWDEAGFLVPENPRTGAAEWTVVPRWDLPEGEDE